MGVYIKGRKIPKSCHDCEFVYWSTKQRASACFLLPFMKCFESHSTEYREKRSELCPLIEVPEPHGRLIDADALLMRINHEVMEAYMDGACYGVHPSQEYLYILGEIIDEATTIIPASVKEE